METRRVKTQTTEYRQLPGGPIAGPIEPALFPDSSPHNEAVGGFETAQRLRLGLAVNSLNVIGTTGINAALGYAYWLVAARWFTPATIGVATAATAAISLAGLLATGGLDTWLVQNLPKTNAQGWSAKVGTALTFCGLAGLITGLCTALIARPRGSGEASMSVGVSLTLISVGAAAWTMTVLIDGAFLADRRADAMLIRNAGFGAVKLAMIVAVAVVGATRSATNLTIVWVAATVISVVASLSVQFRRIKRAVTVRPTEFAESITHMLGTTGWHFLTNMGGRLPMYVFPLIVINRASATENAYFHAAWMLGSLFFVVSTGAASSLLASGAEPGANLSELTRSSVRFISKMLPPLAVVCILFGRFALSLFGPGYAKDGYAMVLVLVAAAIPDGITNIATSQMRLRQHFKQAAALNLFMAISGCVLAYLLVPDWGITGAGAGWAISQTAGAVIVVSVCLERRIRRSNESLTAQ